MEPAPTATADGDATAYQRRGREEFSREYGVFREGRSGEGPLLVTPIEADAREYVTGLKGLVVLSRRVGDWR